METQFLIWRIKKKITTFTFTIDCFPAYTKFNKKKKVMAELQIISTTDTSHNYAEKSIIGHADRDSDNDVYNWNTKSVFGTAQPAHEGHTGE